MTTPTPAPAPEKKRRQNREFRIMYRPTGAFSGAASAAKEPTPPRRKISRILGRGSTSPSLVGDLCAKLAEKSAHWALVVLKPAESAVSVPAGSAGSSISTEIENATPAKKMPRIPVAADDPRIERVFEIRRLRKKPETTNGTVADDDDEDYYKDDDEDYDDDGNSSLGKYKPEKKQNRWGFSKMRAGKAKGHGATRCGSGKGKGIHDDQAHGDRPSTPTDSSEDDRYEDDEGFPDVNKKGKMLKMQVSHKPRLDFAELRFEHLGGSMWEILTGIEARTKFTNSELRHEATRIWKRQQNYHLLDNNCQQFCILLAITIRAKNHSLLRVLHGQTVQRQIRGMKFAKAK